MEIEWFGQGRLHIKVSSGVRIICDPYGEGTGYSIPRAAADIVTVSHDHFDHSAVDTVSGDPEVIRTEGEFSVKGVDIRGVSSWHDSEGGAKRGPNLIFSIKADNMNLVHLGDIGEVPDDEKAGVLRPCDILAVPVGGVFTIGAEEAFRAVEKLSPQAVIPIHYHTPSNTLGLSDSGEFLSKFMDVRRVKSLDITRERLPEMAAVFQLKALGER